MKKNILIVEDEMVISLVLERMVVRQGHNVLAKVASGEEAVEAVKKYKPDVILMDIRLDGQLDGIEAMQTINSENPTPVIFVTGNSDEANRNRANQVDHLDFLTKPVNYNDLCKSLDVAS